VLNSDARARTFKIRRGRESFTYQLHAGAVATFTWPDTPPTVTVTTPTANATVSGLVSIAATADSSAGVQRVDFLVDGQLLASDTTSPYQASWNSVTGAHTLSARATDAAGVTATSVGIPVTVVANQPPSITLTSPTDGTTFTSPANVTIEATAADADGTVSRVDFYNGSVLLASDSTPPFTTIWKVTSPGTFMVSAAATDSGGATTRTPAVKVTVAKKH
jgi:chitinase